MLRWPLAVVAAAILGLGIASTWWRFELQSPMGNGSDSVMVVLSGGRLTLARGRLEPEQDWNPVAAWSIQHAPSSTASGWWTYRYRSGSFRS
ncbi:MAG: hypothetical protein KDA22_15835, partial [Phycisphaerales bacterium]|nr:hypothetical protein [Phycisphaerales bacterium]